MGRRDPSPNLIGGAQESLEQKQQKESITWCGGPLFSQVPHVTYWFSVLKDLGANFSPLDYITWWIFLSHLVAFASWRCCDLGALKERGQCDLGDCVPKHSVSSCDLQFQSYHQGQGCDLGNCVAKTRRFCVCVWKATQSGFGESVSSLPPQGCSQNTWNVLKTLRGQRRNGLSKNTLLDNRFSTRRLRRSFGAPPNKQEFARGSPKYQLFGVSPLSYKAPPRQFQPPKCKLAPSKM